MRLIAMALSGCVTGFVLSRLVDLDANGAAGCVFVCGVLALLVGGMTEPRPGRWHYCSPCRRTVFLRPGGLGHGCRSAGLLRRAR